MPDNNDSNNNNPINSIFEGLGKVINAVSDMTNKGENFRKFASEIDGSDKDKVKTACNFSVKLGLNDDLGSLKTFIQNKHVNPTIEPSIDTFDEEKEFTIIVMVNNIDEKDIRIEPKEKAIVFEAQNSNIHYHKKIDVPLEFTPDSIKSSYKNGIIKISIPKWV